MHARILLREGAEDGERSVFAAVVHEHEFSFHRQGGKRFPHLFVKERKAFLFVITGDDDTQFFHMLYSTVCWYASFYPFSADLSIEKC